MPRRHELTGDREHPDACTCQLCTEPGDNRMPIPNRSGRWWSVSIPGSSPGTMLAIEWDELAKLDAPSGARVEVVGHSALRFRAEFTKREIRRWLACVVDWPGVEVI